MDIVDRLRQQDISGHGMYSALVREAADEIERLRAEVAEWKARWEAERSDHDASIKAIEGYYNQL